MKLYTVTHDNWEDYEDSQETLIYITESLEDAKSVCETYGYKRDENYYGLLYKKTGKGGYGKATILGAVTIEEVETDTLLCKEKLLTDVQ